VGAESCVEFAPQASIPPGLLLDLVKRRPDILALDAHEEEGHSRLVRPLLALEKHGVARVTFCALF